MFDADVLADELLNLHRGQGMDLFWRDNLSCPTTEDYLEMVSNSMSLHLVPQLVL